MTMCQGSMVDGLFATDEGCICTNLEQTFDNTDKVKQILFWNIWNIFLI
jgi:hypothetical protein